MKKILVVHGPNLDLLGKREPEIYGHETLADINAAIEAEGASLGLSCVFFQSNYEGGIIEKIHEAMEDYDGIILNAGAYTHYSYAIRDAIQCVRIPFIEAHMENLFALEDFRNKSVIAPVCAGQIGGLGAESYLLALEALARMK